MGGKNIFIFGMKVEDVIALDQRGYNPMEFYQKSSNLRRCLDQIRAGLFSPKQPDLFSDFIDNLLKWDRFKVCADFDSYIECQKEVSKLYMNQEEWTRQCIYNIAASGKFSSDRTITDYATEIWGAEPQPGYRIPGPTDARPGTE